MGLADELDGLTNYQPEPAPPKGWEPGHVVDHMSGVATYTGFSTTEPIDPDEHRVLTEMGLDPEQWKLASDTLQVRKWNQRAATNEWCWYYRITAERRSGTRVDADFIAYLRSLKSRAQGSDLPGCQVWATSDWQVGKKGTLEVVDQLLALPDRFEASWRKAGKPGHIVVAFVGDLGEGCQHHYPGQTFSVELNYREQRRVVREIAFRIIDRAAKLAQEVTVVAVGGNHGEERSGPKTIATSPGDNRDVAMIEDVRFGFRISSDAGLDRWDHVSWVIPNEDLVATLEAGGVKIAVAHGQQFGGQGEAKVKSWWDRQAGNHRPAAAATLLLSGHYHHCVRYDFGPRTWVQLPAEDAGSPWYAETHGAGGARPGSVTIDLEGTIGDIRVV